MNESTVLDLLSKDARTRTGQADQLVQEFFNIATGAYLNNWGRSFHLPPFAPGQTIEQACAAQERDIARNFVPGQHIIDLGCGVGGPALTIAREIADIEITGVNIVQGQLDEAIRLTHQAGLSGRISFVNTNFTSLSFLDHTFDGAYALDALCHSPDKPRTYQEIHRVLKPGAVFAGADWMCADGLAVSDYRRWIEPVCRYGAVPTILSPSDIEKLLRDAGFTVRSCYDMSTDSDLTPNWDFLDEAAEGIANETDSAHQFMYYHCTSTAAAGRAGAFTIGSWVATA
jgi:SAM-dependent methyltransferase